MAEAVGAASPALKSAVIQCINQPAASAKVQQAAIQVFRLTPIPDEVYSSHQSNTHHNLIPLINLTPLHAVYRAEQCYCRFFWTEKLLFRNVLLLTSSS